MAETGNPELFVHNQLLDLVEPLFVVVDDESMGEESPMQVGWQSRPEWSPKLAIANVETMLANPNDKAITSAAFIVDDSEIFADRNILQDYLDNPFDREFLDEFSRYFADPKHLLLSGLAVVTRPSLSIPKTDVSESTSIDFKAMDFVK